MKTPNQVGQHWDLNLGPPKYSLVCYHCATLLSIVNICNDDFCFKTNQSLHVKVSIKNLQFLLINKLGFGTIESITVYTRILRAP